jgi:hypothetical protein
MGDRAIDHAFFAGRYDEATQRLRDGLEKVGEGQDQLLYLLDLGLALHTAGQYQESNRYFLKAADVADIKDYTSLADEAGTLFTSDNIKHYQGEDFEKVLIHAYLAINFTMMNAFEDAMVEARRVNSMLYRMKTEGKRNYKLSSFARYLSAMLYEATGEFEDARIDYQKMTEILQDFPPLERDLERVRRGKKRYGDGQGEIIVIYQNGISPIKRPNPSFHSVPIFVPRANPVTSAEVEIPGVGKTPTVMIEDVEANAIQNLNEKYAAIVAKKIAGVVAKEVVADQVSKATKNEFWGFLTRVFFYASDQADIRSWNLLPRDFQIARLVVPAGDHDVIVRPIGSGQERRTRATVKPGKMVFLTLRYCP